MRISIYLLIIVLYSCTQSDQPIVETYLSGVTSDTETYLTIDTDTILITNGTFSDTLSRRKDQYNYLKLSSWKWPRIVYLQNNNNLDLNFQEDIISSSNDIFNDYLLNRDSILIPYTARWDMEEANYRDAWAKEFPINLKRIDEYFKDSKTPVHLIDEVKQMEYMRRGHLTANFISYQEKRDKQIDRSIYNFVDSIDFRNDRLGFHQNNRNFQYYYFLDKVSENLPDSIYPFAAIDTINKYVSTSSINSMIISGIVRSGLYDESVDHERLFTVYEQSAPSSESERIKKIYDQIQNLKPGNKAPDFGQLLSADGDSLSIKDLKGKNLLLTAWGTWCPYCKEELPHIKKLLENYPNKFVSVGISLDRDKDKWKSYIEENNWKGIHMIAPERSSTFKKNYLVSGTNIHFLIDKDGVILASKTKPSSDQLEKLIEEIYNKY